MVNWTTVKQLKAEAWKTQSEDDWKKWKDEQFIPFFESAKEAMTEKERNDIKDEIKQIFEKKKAFWSRSKKPFAPARTSYLLQDDLATALAEYLKALTEQIRKTL